MIYKPTDQINIERYDLVEAKVSTGLLQLGLCPLVLQGNGQQEDRRVEFVEILFVRLDVCPLQETDADEKGDQAYLALEHQSAFLDSSQCLVEDVDRDVRLQKAVRVLFRRCAAGGHSGQVNRVVGQDFL